MEEEALQPGGSEETLLERLFSYYGPTEGEVKGQHNFTHITSLNISSTVPPESLTDTGDAIVLTHVFKSTFVYSHPGPNLLLKSEKQHRFLLGHSHGTDWVEYDVLGWLCHAKQNPASQNAVTLLQDSQK